MYFQCALAVVLRPETQTLALSSNKPVALLLCRDLMWEETT